MLEVISIQIFGAQDFFTPDFLPMPEKGAERIPCKGFEPAL